MQELYALCKNPPSISDWNRFWAKVEVKEWRDCWIWQASLDKHTGYGQFQLGRGEKGGCKNAHRIVCIWLHGELPRSLVTDHVVCNNRPCVNPLHLIPCTDKQNLNRPGSKHWSQWTHCKRGHLLAGSNLRNQKDRRQCRICYNAWFVEFRKRRKEALTKTTGQV